MKQALYGRGRERELALHALARPGGGLCLVGGPAGVGKTAFATDVATRLLPDGAVLPHGRCVDAGDLPALWPWRAAAAATECLAAVFDTAEPASRFALGTRMAAALRTLDRPVLVLEDLQWADIASLHLLADVVGADTGARIVATHRSPAVGRLGPHLPELLRCGGTRAVELRELAPDAVAAWLGTEFPTVHDLAGTAAVLHRRTGGNALYLRLLLDGWAGDPGRDLARSVPPPTLYALVAGQLQGFDAESRSVLAAAAVLGDRCRADDLAAIAGGAAAPAMDRAARAGVVRTTDDGWCFAHDVIREVLYRQIPAAERERHHRAAAERLAATEPELPGVIGWHWSKVPGSATETTHYYRRAAREAAAAGQFGDAARALAAALRAARMGTVDQVIEVLLELAAVEFRGGSTPQALQLCREASTLAVDAGLPSAATAAALVVEGFGQPDVQEVVDDLCRRALAVTVAPQDRARLLARRSMAAAALETPARARCLAEEAARALGDTPDPTAQIDVLHAQHVALCAPQYVERRRDLARRMLDAARPGTDPLVALWGHLWSADAALQLGDLDEADRHTRSIDHLAGSTRLLLARWHAARLHAVRAVLAGDVAAARAHNRLAAEIGAQAGDEGLQGLTHAFAGNLELLDPTYTAEQVAAEIAISRRAPQWPVVRVFTPLLHAVSGDLPAARATFAEFAGHPLARPDGPRETGVLLQAAVVAVILDDAATARAAFDALSGYRDYYSGDGGGVLFSFGAIARVLGELALTAGDPDAAIEHHRIGLRLNERIGALPFAALSRLGLADALRAAGNPTGPESDRLTEEAETGFRALGMSVWADRARHRRTAPATAPAGADPILTRREQQIVVLLAAGRTNREIAEEFVLSGRTVETHVRNVLTKLGLRNRTEIAAWSRAPRRP